MLVNISDVEKKMFMDDKGQIENAFSQQSVMYQE